MQIIYDAAALEAVTEPTLAPVLERYRDLMDLAVLFIIQPGDILASLEEARGQPFADWEFIHSHPVGWHEAVFVISDDGFGHVVLIPDQVGIDPDLLRLCQTYGVPYEEADTATF